jgi:hypothetical protein
MLPYLVLRLRRRAVEQDLSLLCGPGQPLHEFHGATCRSSIVWTCMGQILSHFHNLYAPWLRIRASIPAKLSVLLGVTMRISTAVGAPKERHMGFLGLWG